MTARLPLELRSLLIPHAHIWTKSRPNVFTFASRLQSTTPTSVSPRFASTIPPTTPGAARRRRGGVNLGAYPQLIHSALLNSSSNNHDPNAYVSLSSTPAFTSFQETPQPGDIPLMKDPIPAQIPSVRSPGQGLKETPKRVLRGIELPERPIPPASDECCMGGCAVCVYDLYSEAVEEYHADLATARTKLLASDVPKDLWPNDVLESGQDGKSVGNKAKDAVDDEIDRLDASLKAFLAMERALKKKRVGANEGRAG